MSEVPLRYRSADEDSGRWMGYAYRPGDIVISTRSKHGTTWMQMICALLVLQSLDLPMPLAQFSPWLDWLVVPREEVFARLRAQRHRRVVKTHTPLDGIPLDPQAWYIVVVRHPLDAAVSLYHQQDNLDRERIRQLTGSAPSQGRPSSRPPLQEWMARWIDEEANPVEQLDSLPGVLRHLSDAWRRRAEPNVLLVHYNDLSTDLEGQMRRLALWLGIDVPAHLWPELVTAAGFAAMQQRAHDLAPDPAGVLRDSTRFFRRGSPGSASETLPAEELERYSARAAQLADDDLLAWLHRDEGKDSRETDLEEAPWAT